jgi:hypothetical protein
MMMVMKILVGMVKEMKKLVERVSKMSIVLSMSMSAVIYVDGNLCR